MNQNNIAWLFFVIINLGGNIFAVFIAYYKPFACPAHNAIVLLIAIFIAIVAFGFAYLISKLPN